MSSELVIPIFFTAYVKKISIKTFLIFFYIKVFADFQSAVPEKVHREQ